MTFKLIIWLKKYFTYWTITYIIIIIMFIMLIREVLNKYYGG
jgi:hypothetical protein